jgi:hypothetical protein
MEVLSRPHSSLSTLNIILYPLSLVMGGSTKLDHIYLALLSSPVLFCSAPAPDDPRSPHKQVQSQFNGERRGHEPFSTKRSHCSRLGGDP